MPIIVSGGDSDTASQRDLRIFALCSLIDKRDASRTQMNVIGFSILCIIMASWGLKISLGVSCILLCISIIFAIYALYMESRTLRQIQRELMALLRDTPRADIRDFFSNNVEDMHEDWKKNNYQISVLSFYQISVRRKLEIHKRSLTKTLLNSVKNPQ